MPTTQSASTSTLSSIEKAAEAFLTDLKKPSSKVSKIAAYLTDAISVLGVVVGAFDHPLGLSISAAPQGVILGVSAAALLGINVFRLVTKHSLAKALVGAVGTSAASGSAQTSGASPTSAPTSSPTSTASASAIGTGPGVQPLAAAEPPAPVSLPDPTAPPKA